MSENELKYLRIFLLALVGSLGGKSLVQWGISGFPWYVSDWGVFNTIGTMLLLTLSHFRTYDPYYDSLVKSIFMIVYPMQWMITVLYWSAYYTPGNLVWSDLSTWVYPIFMHVVPLIAI